MASTCTRNYIVSAQQIASVAHELFTDKENTIAVNINCSASLPDCNGLIKQDTSRDRLIMSLGVNINNQIKRPNPKFTLGFKQDTVKLIAEKGYTHQQAAGSLGVSLSAIGRWSRAERGPAIPSSTKTATLNLADQAGLLRLRKEIEQLRMGRVILKKAAGIEAKEIG
jgi:transposase